MISPATMKKHLPNLHLPPPVWRRWLPLWHSLAYLLTLGIAIVALYNTHTWQTRLLLLLGFVLWLGWYSIYVRVEPLWWGNHTAVASGYLLIGAVLWIALSTVNMTCMFFLCILYTLVFLFVAMPWKIILAFLLAILQLGSDVVMNGGWSTDSLISFGVSISCIVLAIFVTSVIRQSEVQRRLIKELEVKRKELSREERRAGMAEERQRLAYEIHDTLAQGFTSILMHLEAAEIMLPEHIDNARQHLDQAQLTARENITEARHLIWALQPHTANRTPLPEVLKVQTEKWANESQIAANITITGYPRALRPEYEHILLRTTQEALTNVRKHAHASHVTVTLSYMEDIVTLDIQDDGQGFPCDTTQYLHDLPHTNGFGLHGLKTRVEKLGGTFVLESSPGEGTTIAISLPEFQEEYEEYEEVQKL